VPATQLILKKIRALGWVVNVERGDGFTAIYVTKPGEGPLSYACQGDGRDVLLHAAREIAKMIGVDLTG